MNKAEIVIKPKSNWSLVDVGELWRFRQLFYIFSWRDIKVRYKQTALGIIWVLFQPIVNTIVFTVIFGNFAKIPSGGLPYPVFVLLGLIYWGFFSASLNRASNSFIENESLIKKVYFPREILPISTVITALVDFFVSLVIMFVVFAFFPVTINFAFLGMMILGLLVTTTTSVGLGLLLASINIKYRDIRYAIPFFLQLLIFVTPVIYPLKLVRPSFQFILSFNPMTGVIEALRSTLETGAINDPFKLIMAIISSGIILFIGLAYFRKTERFFADIL